MAAGGLFTLVAAYLTSRIKDEVELPEGAVEEGHAVRRPRRSGEGRSLMRGASFSGLEY
jgi:solute carrier family 45 protein 1/2/4